MTNIVHDGGGACCIRFTERLNTFDEHFKRSATLTSNHDPVWSSEVNTGRGKVENLLWPQD